MLARLLYSYIRPLLLCAALPAALCLDLSLALSHPKMEEQLRAAGIEKQRKATSPTQDYRELGCEAALCWLSR